MTHRYIVIADFDSPTPTIVARVSDFRSADKIARESAENQPRRTFTVSARGDTYRAEMVVKTDRKK